jgi:CubicO group peptidase (beta-lactamase class C family)
VYFTKPFLAVLPLFFVSSAVDVYGSGEYSAPPQFNDGIKGGNLAVASLDAAPIQSLLKRSRKPENEGGFRELHSLLVYKDGFLVLEEYFAGNNDFIHFENGVLRDSGRERVQWSRDDKHYVASVNKSLTATVAGIALDRFQVLLNQPIASLLPVKSELFNTEKKASVTLQHVLTMQLGFEWNEWESKDLALMWKSGDFTGFLLSRDNDGPGFTWRYNSAAPNMLLRALENLVHEPIRIWADREFYARLGITDYRWESQPDGYPEGSARMYLRPRDMLKIGICYLDGGVWNGKQIIPGQWVDAVSRVQARSDAGDYSYYFWLRNLKGFHYISAEGDGGQYINIFPDQDMVIVMTQGNYLEWPFYADQADDIMANYIFSAMNLTQDTVTP